MAKKGTLTRAEPRQRVPHQERRQQIVEAARKIITGRGMEHLTMGTLAEEVGVSEGGIYRHVASKQEVLLLVLDDIEEGLLDTVARAQEEAASPLDKLKNVLRAHLSYAERRRGVSFLVLGEALRLQDRKLRKQAGRVVERYLEAIRCVLLRGKEVDEVGGDVDLETAARLFFGMIQGHVTFWALQSHSFPLTERYEELWELYRKAVAEGS